MRNDDPSRGRIITAMASEQRTNRRIPLIGTIAPRHFRVPADRFAGRLWRVRETVETALDRDGWIAIERVLSADSARELTDRCQGVLADASDRRMNDKPAAGTTRATELLERLPDLRTVLDVAPVRAAVEHLLGAPADLYDANLRVATPGFGEQEPHRDGLPLEPGACDGVTCIIALCDFTPRNGSTEVFSGSHHLPRDMRRSNRRGTNAQSGERLLGPAGTAFVFTAQLVHRGTRNDTDEPRPGLQLFWRRRTQSP